MSSFAPEETKLLALFFGRSVNGVEAALRSPAPEIPEGLKREMLERYRAIAVRAVAQGHDELGVQAKRLELIDRALPLLRWSTTPAHRADGYCAARSSR